MIYLLIGLLTWGLGTAWVVYSGHRDHADLILPDFPGGSPAGEAVRPVEVPAADPLLPTVALRGAPRTPSLPVLLPGREVARPDAAMPLPVSGRAFHVP